MNDVLNFVTQTVTVDVYGVEQVTEETKQVFCDVQSIQQSEFYAAADTELNPEYRFIVFFGDYSGQSIVVYNGVRYSIYRTYRNGDLLEIYVERKIGV